MMNGPAPQQKHPRYPTRTPVELYVARDRQPEELFTYDVSRTGAFIETAKPRGPGVRLGMRLLAPESAVGVIARVVYVLDEGESRRKAHVPGMGVEFDSVDDAARRSLDRFIDGLARASAAAESALPPPAARFESPTSVVLELEGRDDVERAWHRELKSRGLFVPTEHPPTRGARVQIVLRTPDGSLILNGEIVHVLSSTEARGIGQPAGAGIAITDLVGPKRDALERYIAGTAAMLGLAVSRSATTSRYALQEVLLAVRRLFAGIDGGDPYAACGLPRGASPGDVKGRTSLLARMFASAPEGATPPQAARIAAAARALQRVEATLQTLLARDGEIVARTATAAAAAKEAQRSLDDQRKELLATADQEQREGNLVFARRALQAVLQLFPHDLVVQRRIELITGRLDATRAEELLESAEVFIRQSGMKAEAGSRAREALQLTPNARPVQLRVLRILVQLDAQNEVVQLARRVVDEDPTQALAWEALLLIYERRGHVALASRAAQELIKLRPQDKEMMARAKKLKALLR